jgi:hypothetical protein
MPTATLKGGMEPQEFGRKLGIGMRLAGRIAMDRAQSAASSPDPVNQAAALAQEARQLHTQANQAARQVAVQAGGKVAKAAGRGLLGFLRPFTRVGHILWLEVTGVFFGLFTLWFAVDLGRIPRNAYTATWYTGPFHQRILMDALLGLFFAYLSLSSFWRARRK